MYQKKILIVSIIFGKVYLKLEKFIGQICYINLGNNVRAMAKSLKQINK